MPEMMSLTSVCEPKPIGDADHAGAGDQRADLDAQGRERHQHRHHDQHDEQHVARDRQQRAHRARRCMRLRACRRGRSPAASASWRSIQVRSTCQSRSTTSRITTACRAPRSSRDSVVSPAIELTSTSQIQASSRAAPMIQSARRPRSSRTRQRRHGLRVLGARWAQDVATDRLRDQQQCRQAGQRPAPCRTTDGRRAARAARASTSATVRQPLRAALSARRRRRILLRAQRGPPPERQQQDTEPDERERCRRAGSAPRSDRPRSIRNQSVQAWAPVYQPTISVSQKYQCRADAVLTGRMRNLSAPGARMNRSRTVVSQTTTTTSRQRAIRPCSSGGQSNSRKAPSEPSAKAADPAQAEGEPAPDGAQPRLHRVQRHRDQPVAEARRRAPIEPLDAEAPAPGTSRRAAGSPTGPGRRSPGAERPGCAGELGHGGRQGRERGQNMMADRPSPERSCRHHRHWSRPPARAPPVHPSAARRATGAPPDRPSGRGGRGPSPAWPRPRLSLRAAAPGRPLVPSASNSKPSSAMTTDPEADIRQDDSRLRVLARARADARAVPNRADRTLHAGANLSDRRLSRFCDCGKPS